MRDDLRDFFTGLLEHLDLKTTLLDSFLKNEKSVSDLLKYKTDNEDEIQKIIESESLLIDEINVEDYNISRYKDQIIQNYRFDFEKISNRNYNTTEPGILQYREKIQCHKKILDEIIDLKNRNNFLMDKNRDYLKTQINELERIRSIEIIYPDKAGSF